MHQNRQSPAASPPDDAGHRGSFTVPEETIEMHAADRPLRAPALNSDCDRYEGGADGASSAWMIVAGLVFAAITAFFVVVRL